MRITVNLVIDLDPDAWAREYGLGDERGKVDKSVIRSDVREYVLNAIQGTAGIEAADGEVSLR